MMLLGTNVVRPFLDQFHSVTNERHENIFCWDQVRTQNQRLRSNALSLRLSCHDLSTLAAGHKRYLASKVHTLPDTSLSRSSCLRPAIICPPLPGPPIRSSIVVFTLPRARGPPAERHSTQPSVTMSAHASNLFVCSRSGPQLR